MAWLPNLSSWESDTPFDHLIVDDFLPQNILDGVVKEFPAFDDDVWFTYNNPIEVKKAHNNWNRFGPVTYSLFSFLNSEEFIDLIQFLPECGLFADPGLHGGGLHTHAHGGKLNVHQDYSIHPKLKLERRLNLIIYVTPGWRDDWGGHLGLYSDPDTLVRSIAPKFNRAVFFDTTQNSWHGLPEPIQCPDHVTRNSLAAYYLCTPRTDVSTRGRALFSANSTQQGNSVVQGIIDKRVDVNTSAEVYREAP